MESTATVEQNAVTASRETGTPSAADFIRDCVLDFSLGKARRITARTAELS